MSRWRGSPAGFVFMSDAAAGSSILSTPMRDLESCRNKSSRVHPDIASYGTCDITAVYFYVLLEQLVDHRHIDPGRERQLHVSHRRNQPMTEVTLRHGTEIQEQRHTGRPYDDIYPTNDLGSTIVGPRGISEPACRPPGNGWSGSAS
jgi:hypothetical protein